MHADVKAIGGVTDMGDSGLVEQDGWAGADKLRHHGFVFCVQLV